MKETFDVCRGFVNWAFSTGRQMGGISDIYIKSTHISALH